MKVKWFRVAALVTTMVTVLVAIAIASVIISVCTNPANTKALDKDPVYNGFLMTYLIMLIVQFCLIAVGFLGYNIAFANWRNNYQMDHSVRVKFIFWVAFWSLFSLCNLGVAIFTFVRSREPQEEIASMYQTFAKYNSDVKFVAQLERYQRENGCCGVYGPDDWLMVQLHQGAGGLAGPPGGGSSGFQSLDYGFRQNPSTGQCFLTPPTIPSGCGRKMLEEIHITLNMFGGVMVVETLIAMSSCVFGTYSFFYWLEKEVIVIPEDEVSNLIVLEPESSTSQSTDAPGGGPSGTSRGDPFLGPNPEDDPYYDPYGSDWGAGSNYRSYSSYHPDDDASYSAYYPYGVGTVSTVPEDGSNPDGAVLLDSNGEVIGAGSQVAGSGSIPGGGGTNASIVPSGSAGGGQEDAAIIFSRQNFDPRTGRYRSSHHDSRSRFKPPTKPLHPVPTLNHNEFFQRSKNGFQTFINQRDIAAPFYHQQNPFVYYEEEERNQTGRDPSSSTSQRLGQGQSQNQGQRSQSNDPRSQSQKSQRIQEKRSSQNQIKPKSGGKIPQQQTKERAPPPPQKKGADPIDFPMTYPKDAWKGFKSNHNTKTQALLSAAGPFDAGSRHLRDDDPDDNRHGRRGHDHHRGNPDHERDHHGGHRGRHDDDGRRGRHQDQDRQDGRENRRGEHGNARYLDDGGRNDRRGEHGNARYLDDCGGRRGEHQGGRYLEDGGARRGDRYLEEGGRRGGRYLEDGARRGSRYLEGGGRGGRYLEGQQGRYLDGQQGQGRYLDPGAAANRYLNTGSAAQPPAPVAPEVQPGTYMQNPVVVNCQPLPLAGGGQMEQYIPIKGAAPPPMNPIPTQFTMPSTPATKNLRKQEQALGGRLLGEMHVDHSDAEKRKRPGDSTKDPNDPNAKEKKSKHATVAIVRNKNAKKAKNFFATNPPD